MARPEVSRDYTDCHRYVHESVTRIGPWKILSQVKDGPTQQNMHVIRTIGLREKVDPLGRLLFFVPFVFVRETIKTSIIAIQRGLLLREFIVATVIRTLMTCFTPRQLLYINGSTSQTYQAWINKEANIRNLSPVPDSVTLADGSTRLHWIRKTDDKASKVVLFFHGGGYFIPMAPEHLRWCASIVKNGRTVTKTMAVAVLEYDLTSQQRYPRQLQQAVLALDHLLRLGIQPEDIFIGGDSAGGHLALGLLSHLMHKHPSLPDLNIDSPLAGAFLISPWVTDDASTPSYKQNAWVDMLPRPIGLAAAKWLVPSDVRRTESEKKQGWAMPLDADDNWWQTLADVVFNVYITAGEQEMFRDHIIMFADMLRKQSPKCRIKFELGVAEAHDHMLIWEILHARKNPALERLLNWLAKTLGE